MNRRDLAAPDDRRLAVDRVVDERATWRIRWWRRQLASGMLMLGATLQFSRATLKVLLLAGLAGNPVDLARVLSLLAVGGPHLFGPAGATLVKMTGSASVAGVLGLAALLLWILIPLLISIRLFSRQNL